jgi:hypothetical protein
MVYVICKACIQVFRLNYQPRDPDEWWCEACAGWAARRIDGAGGGRAGGRKSQVSRVMVVR